MIAVHRPAGAIVTISLTCPLTPLEWQLRELAGGSSYEGGFIDQYLEGVVYPFGSRRSPGWSSRR